MTLPSANFPNGTAARLIEVALKEIGTIEDGDNLVKYNDRNGQPWCGYFVDYCLKAAGVKGTPSMVATSIGAHKMKDLGRWIKDKPMIGDLIFFDFLPDQVDRIQHVGIVAGIKSGSIITIEGNTAPASGSQSNGGMVMIKSRSRIVPTSIVGFARPKFVAFDGAPPNVTYSDQPIRKKAKK